jgi:hypothetical protein
LAGDNQNSNEANSMDNPQRENMALYGLMLPRKNRSWAIEATPPKIHPADDRSQKRIGYRVNGKNGFIREYGSDQSTSGVKATLDNAIKTRIPEPTAAKKATFQVICGSPV